MNQDALKQTLSTRYDRASWRSVLTDVFGVRELHREPKRIPISNKDIAESAVELGSLETVDSRLVGIYEVELTDKPRIWQNRVGLRQLLRSVYRDVDAAIVVFIQGDKWRLSLISEIRVRDEETGEIVEQRTEPKRYTYLLGKGETVRTPVDRLIELGEGFISLDALIEAFSVEPLNKAFFREYKDVFDKLLDEVRKTISDEETARLFAQRLLNRLMFLYFIQKKGWMKFEGDTNYLRSVFDASIGGRENFYRDRLYYVFFYGLSNHAESKEIHDDEKLEAIRGQVPYLNGGLFELEKDGTDEKGKINVSNERFSEVLDLFERYNFTIDESTPFEVQVAVDPEMLGKVFEELVTGRHESGSYYTPRTIVSYMCREALKHSLEGIDTPESIAKLVDENDGGSVADPEKVLLRLRNLRICDPACGSGAYLLGMLQELLHIREALFASTTIAKNAQYNWKREIIESNIFGVDIDRFATQIAALRLWLSLAIESERPKALPNLKYKIGCGDSLLAPLESDLQLDLHRRALVEEFKKTKKKYTDADSHPEKAEAEAEIERLRVEIARTLRHLPEPPSPAKLILARKSVEPLRKEVAKAVANGDKQLAESRQKKLDALLSEIAKWETEQTVNRYETGNVFDWSVEFAEVFEEGGFDIALANPPYVQLQAKGGKLATMYQNVGYKTFVRAGDVYALFYERSFELLKDGGVLSFITSNKWMRTAYGEKMRKFFVEMTQPLLLIDFGSVKVFENVVVDNNILVLRKSLSDDGKGAWVARIGSNFKLSQNLKDYVHEHGYKTTALTHNSWVVGDRDEFDIKGRVEKQGIEIRYWNVRINRGIVTGFNDAFIVSDSQKKRIEARAKQNGEDRSAEVFKRILRGKDIKAWYPDFSDLWLIYLPWHFPLHEDSHITGASPEAEAAFRQYYPAVYEHLLGFKDGLSNRNKAETGIRYEWYALQRFGSKFWRDFDLPKIIYPNMTKFLPFVYDDSSFYVNQKCFIVTGDNLEYLTCFFNSKLFKFCFSDNFPNLGEDRRELSKVYFEKIPVKRVSVEHERVFEVIVEHILLLQSRIRELKENGEEYNENLVKVSLFEQVSDALILETYLPEDFEKFEISIMANLPNLTLKSDELAEELQNRSSRLQVNLSAMKSIPAVQLIYNTVRI